MKDKVFICYSRKDGDFVLKLAANLKSKGVPVWLDQWDIPTGANWPRAIDRALSECTRLLLVLSPASVESDDVQSEWLSALDETKVVLPILYRPCHIPFRLKSIQYIDFTSRSPDDERALEHLLSALGASARPQREAGEQGRPTHDGTIQKGSKDQKVPLPETGSAGSQAKAGKFIAREVVVAAGLLVLLIAVGLWISPFHDNGQSGSQNTPASPSITPSSGDRQSPGQNVPSVPGKPEESNRGVITNLGVEGFTWDSTTFPGFYHDTDHNLGTETLTFRLSDVSPSTAVLSDQLDANGEIGVVYKSSAQLKKFEFSPWGKYQVIGFLGEGYFAAYADAGTADDSGQAALLYNNSRNRDLMTNEQISRILVDSNKELTITPSSPLMLQEGYQLRLNSIDNTIPEKVYLTLSKNGQDLDHRVIQPTNYDATIGEDTYLYKADLDQTSGIVQIAVHFKNAFRDATTNIPTAVIDGVFQISDTTLPLKLDQQFDKMSVRMVDPTAGTIVLDNKDNKIILSKNEDIPLIERIHIRTADQDGTAENPLRYYIYSKLT